MKTTLIATAQDGGAMTLDELAAAVHAAHRHDMPGESMVKVRVGFGGRIKRIEVTAP